MFYVESQKSKKNENSRSKSSCDVRQSGAAAAHKTAACDIDYRNKTQG